MIVRVDAAEDVVFQTVFAKETREMHAKEARQSEREREKKRDARRKKTKKSAERATIYVFKRATPRSRATREKERAGKTLRFFPKIAGPFAGREKKKKKETRKKKKNFESALTSTSTRPPLCELDGLTR